MTLTENPPEVAMSPAAAPASYALEGAPSSGLVGWIVTSDHKKTGRLFAWTAAVLAVPVLGLGGLLAAEAIASGGTQILGAGRVEGLYALFRWGLAFGVLVPLLLGLAIAVVPLQLGARAISFPRAANLAFWLWLVGIGLVIGAVAADGGPGGGNREAVRLFLLASAPLLLGLALGAVSVVATILTRRAPGMRLDRAPAFAIASLVASIMLVITLGVLVGLVLLMYLDVDNGELLFGGATGVWDYLDWAVAQPTLYLYAVGALGIIVDIAATSSGRRLAMRRTANIGFAFAALFSFGAWAQQAFNPGIRTSGLWIAVNALSVVPVLLVIGVSSAALAGRSTRPRSTLPWAVGGGLLILLGVVAGAVTGIEDLELLGTTWELGVALLVGLGTLLAALGGLAHWGPKLHGRLLPGGPSSGLAVLGIPAALLAGGVYLVLGAIDQPLGGVNFSIDGPYEVLNAIAAAGLAVSCIVVIGFLAFALLAFTGGQPAGDDPWDGHTLEWATSSPPPENNFPQRPVAISAEPLLDLKEAK